MSTLDNLRKEAKRWLKALRANDSDARARLDRANPSAPADAGLRDVQHALARERGHENWVALKAAAMRAGDAPQGRGGETDDTHVATFLEHACPDWRMGGGPRQIMHRHTAERLLRRHPEIRETNLFTRIVCGDLEGVTLILAERPDAASTPGGPKNWPPLLYLCAGRLSLATFADHALAIARALLDRGADPNGYFLGGNDQIHYTALTLVIGRGEEAAPPHVQAKGLAALLLERGAEPYDNQVFYNISQGYLNDDSVWLLDLIYAHAVQRGRAADWADPEWSMIDMGGYGRGARFILEAAVKGNHLGLARWALEHGASPNTVPARDPRWSKRTLHDEARRRGLVEMADLLARHGAVTSASGLEGEDALLAASFQLDRITVERLLARHPEYLQSPLAMHEAARLDRVDVVALLLALGISPDVEDAGRGRQRPLHVAAYAGAARVARLLIDGGAEVDPVDSTHDGTPLWFAMWGRQQATIDILSRVSRDLWALVATGNVGRLRELLSEKPERAKARGTESIPLMWLPDDERRAREIVELFLAHGADASIRRQDGLTAAEIARRRGLDDAAAMLSAAEAGAPAASSAPASLAQYESLAHDLTLAFDAGDEGALRRIGDHYHRVVTWEDVRAGVWQRVRVVRERGGGSGAFPVDEARELLAREAGFGSWTAFTTALVAGTPPPGDAFAIDARLNSIRPRRALSARDWDALIAVMKERRITRLEAGGQITDAALAQIAGLGHVTRLDLGGSQQLTDEGVGHLARMPQLRELSLSHYPGGAITDRALEVLRHLTELRKFEMTWQRGISDRGVANLAYCDRLEDVNLLGTATGDGVIRALTGKPALRMLKTGRLVTDEGLGLLQQFPAFASWQGGEVRVSLMGFDAGPTHLLVGGTFTDRGLTNLKGLDGLFGLSFFGPVPALTSSGLSALSSLSNLGFLGLDGDRCDDEAMRHIAAIPRLRMLMGQGTVATDVGFEALSRSRTLEYLWGRECPNLTGRGFVAMASMPSLRGLAVSCRQVDDAALSVLPRFPALRELMPMDVTDDGFRHVGRCQQLESLWCMYCRDTTDTATEHLAGLGRLRTYYAGATQITDRSLEVLSRLPSLERVELYECAGITDTGLASLARLKTLREVSLHGLPAVTLEGTAVFPAQVRVDYTV